MLQPLLASLAICVGALAQAPSSDVAVGVFPFLVGNMDGRVNEIVSNCQTHGIDTLYVSVFRATGPSTGTLWITDNAGDWNQSWGQVRPNGAGIDLAALIPACHAASVRVVGVLKCFDGTVQPDNFAHRQYLLDVIDYLVDPFQPNGQPVYDLDGIALDYVRYVGGSGVNHSLVTSFVADVRDHIGALSLHAYLIANRYTFDGPNYNGQFASYATVHASLASQFGQYWEHLARYVDVMMPMAYTADGSIYSTYTLHQAYVQRTAAYARTACQNAGFPGRRICPTIRTYTSSGETTTTQTVDASITGALLGGDGYQAFRYQHLVSNPAWWGPMASHAVPGCNWPVPLATVGIQFLTANVDPTASRDIDQLSASLQVRVDFDSDGQFDTPWQANGPVGSLSPYVVARRATLQVRDNTGHVSTTRRRYIPASPIEVVPFFVRASTGGTVNVRLDVGPAGAGDVYLLLASLSGTSPGFVWMPGLPVPLNIDFLTMSLAANPNGGLLTNGLGTFDVNGHATAMLTVPPGVAAPFAWSPVNWSFVAMDPLTGPSCVGDSQPLIIWP